VPQGWKMIYAPVFMNYLIRYISGVDYLERKQKKHPEFAAYAEETSPFIPWFPKQAKKKNN